MISFFYIFTAVALIASIVNLYFENFLIVASMGVLYIFYVIWGCVNIKSNLFVSAQCRFKSKDSVLLTFDDGPTQNTEVLLDVLKKHKITAMFFCIGKQVEQYPDLAKRIVDEGHLIGLHTYSHNPFFLFKTEKWLTKDFKVCQNIVLRHTGVSSNIYRPVYGHTNIQVASLVRKQGLKVIGWNIRSMDTMTDNNIKIYERIKALLEPGSIILLHDTNRDIVWLIDKLAEQFAKRKIRFAHPKELID